MRRSPAFPVITEYGPKLPPVFLDRKPNHTDLDMIRFISYEIHNCPEYGPWTND